MLAQRAGVEVTTVHDLGGWLFAPVRSLLYVTYYQGLRRTERANLWWAAVDPDRGALHVRNLVAEGELKQSRKNRTIPLRAKNRGDRI